MIDNGTESDWIKFAELPVTSGKIAVSDPVFCNDLPPCPRFDMKADVYPVYVKVVSWLDDQRVSRLRVSRKEESVLGRVLDDVGVDFAQVGVFDPELIETACKTLSKEQGDAILEAYNNVKFHGVARFDDSSQAVMPFATSGFGDGHYPIFELTHNGERVGLEVVFIGPEVEYETV